MRNKYNAKKITYEGQIFDSKKELKRYLELSDMEKRGLISDLDRQIRYILIDAVREPSTFNSRGREIPGKVIERSCEYRADFRYRDKDNNVIVEDVKGYRGGGAYAVFKIKKKLMLSRYGIRVREV